MAVCEGFVMKDAKGQFGTAKLSLFNSHLVPAIILLDNRIHCLTLWTETL